MKKFTDLEWVYLAQTMEEFDRGLQGVRAERHGVRMEVRVLNTMTHGTHIWWAASSDDHLLLVVGQIPLPLETRRSDLAFIEGKKRAIKFAELWVNKIRDLVR